MVELTPSGQAFVHRIQLHLLRSRKATEAPALTLEFDNELLRLNADKYKCSAWTPSLRHKAKWHLLKSQAHLEKKKRLCFYFCTCPDSTSLPHPTPSCQPGCLARIHCNLFAFIMLICGRKYFCHLRIAGTAMVNTLACL